jgi:hypothetical protein
MAAVASARDASALTDEDAKALGMTAAQRAKARR